MPRHRPRTDAYLEAVERAVSSPGTWVTVGAEFKTERNAAVTARCLRGGYLRVLPQEGDDSVVAEGRHCIRIRAPVETRVAADGDGWTLRVRVPR